MPPLSTLVTSSNRFKVSSFQSTFFVSSLMCNNMLQHTKDDDPKPQVPKILRPFRSIVSSPTASVSLRNMACGFAFSPYIATPRNPQASQNTSLRSTISIPSKRFSAIRNQLSTVFRLPQPEAPNTAMGRREDKWEPIDRSTPVSSFMYYPPTFEETEPELMTITERRAREQRYAEARSRLEPTEKTSNRMHRSELTRSFVDTTVDDSPEDCEVLTAQTAKLRRASICITTKSRRSFGRQETLPERRNFSMLEKLHRHPTTLEGDIIPESTDKKAKPEPKHQRNQPSKTLPSNANLSQAEGNATTEPGSAAVLSTPRPLPPIPAFQPSSSSRIALRTQPSLDVWEFTASSTSHACSGELSLAGGRESLGSTSKIPHTLSLHALRPQESNLTLAIRNAEEFSEIGSPFLSRASLLPLRPIATEHPAPTTSKLVFPAQALNTDLNSNLVLDNTADIFENLINLQSLLNQLEPHTPDPTDSPTFGIEDVSTVTDLADYLQVNLIECPTLKQLHKFLRTSSTKLEQGWIEELYRISEEMVVSAEALRVLIETKTIVLGEDGFIAREHEGEAWEVMDQNGILLETADALVDGLKGTLEKVERLLCADV